MPTKSATITREELIDASHALMQAVGAITQTAADMLEMKVASLDLPWTDKDWEAIETVVKLGQAVMKKSPLQLVKQKVGKPGKRSAKKDSL